MLAFLLLTAILVSKKESCALVGHAANVAHLGAENAVRGTWGASGTHRWSAGVRKVKKREGRGREDVMGQRFEVDSRQQSNPDGLRFLAGDWRLATDWCAGSSQRAAQRGCLLPQIRY